MSVSSTLSMASSPLCCSMITAAMNLRKRIDCFNISGIPKVSSIDGMTIRIDHYNGLGVQSMSFQVEDNSTIYWKTTGSTHPHYDSDNVGATVVYIETDECCRHFLNFDDNRLYPSAQGADGNNCSDCLVEEYYVAGSGCLPCPEGFNPAASVPTAMY